MDVFFFQAEDGIRDPSVTGVQTCALPICRNNRCRAGRGAAGVIAGLQIDVKRGSVGAIARRSEGKHFGVGLPRPWMKPLAYDLFILHND